MSEESKQPEESLEETAEAVSPEGSDEAAQGSQTSPEDAARAEAEAMVAEAMAAGDDDETAEIPAAQSDEEERAEAEAEEPAQPPAEDEASAAEPSDDADEEDATGAVAADEATPSGETAPEEPEEPEEPGETAARTAEPLPDYSYDDLNGMTIAALRDVASRVEHEAVQGYSQMHKEQLLPALCTALGIEAHVHHEVVGIDKREIKAKIRDLKVERDRALEAGDGEQLKQVRRRIHNLKHQLRKATV